MPGDVSAGGACAGALEKSTKTCNTSCTFDAAVCALPKGWTKIADPPGGFAGRIFGSTVWTAGEMIVFGGGTTTDGGPGFKDGAIYSLAKNTWSVLATSPLSARRVHTAVWTGLTMIVWGGDSASTYRADGAEYDAFSKSWSMLPASPLTARTAHAAVWVPTTNEMIVWGGKTAAGPAADGAAFNPTTDSWTSLPAAPIGARSLHAMYWTGTEVLIFGGRDSSGDLDDGALYDPVKKTWRKLPASGLGGRLFPTTAFDGNFLTFAGQDGAAVANDGAILKVGATPSWTPLAATPAEFTTRTWMQSWSVGGRLTIWSGIVGGATPSFPTDGVTYDTTAGSWTYLKADSSAPTGRALASTASTGSGAIVWSGLGKPGGGIVDILTDGAVYVP
jgi:hypothetical protein